MTDIATPAAPVAYVRPDSLLRRFAHNPAGVFGTVVFLIIVLACVVGPLLLPFGPQTMDLSAKNLGPSWPHLLGTDNLGRDQFAQLLSGGRTSLAVGLFAMLLSTAIGVVVGTLSGYFRSLDGALMRLTDLFMSLPLLPLLLIATMLFRDSLRAMFGLELGMFLMVVTMIGLTSWMNPARIIRAEVLAIKERDFIMAARSVGTTTWPMLVRHVLPNIVSPLVVSASMAVAGAIVTESALSFLGLGFPSDFPTWGRLLFDGANFMTLNPGRVIWPGIAISLTVLSINYMGDALRDLLDPRAARRGT